MHMLADVRRLASIGLAVFLGASSASCAHMAAFAEGYAQAAAATGGGVVATGELLVFGGRGHDTFLGCLNCNQYATNSIHNEYGSFGNPYAQNIRNSYSEFGSGYSQYSACNKYASDPPVIVDRAGKYYGRLTLNTSRSDVARGYLAWLAATCAN